MPQIIEGGESFRLFVNLGTTRCASACTYCYVPPGREEPFNWTDIESALAHMQNLDRFVRGRHGTIMTFGGHTEIFRDAALMNLLIRALSLAGRFGNPIQVSTKQLVGEETLRAIQGSADHAGQITLFVSGATISRAHELERGADAPRERWKTFTNIRAVGLPCALLIKPWLGGATERDLDDFAKVAADYQLDAVCLGALYATRPIENRLSQVTVEGAGLTSDAAHPLIAELHKAIAPPPDVFRTFRTLVRPTPLYASSVCVSAAFARRACPIHPEASCFV